MTHSTEKQPFLQTVKLITQSFNFKSHVQNSAEIFKAIFPKEPGTLHIIYSYLSTRRVMWLSINATSKHAQDVVSSKGAFHRTCCTRQSSNKACHNPASRKRTIEVYAYVSTD